MGKQKIILADTDSNYLASLEMKFIEELKDSDSDLEVITDELYFREYFSQARQADVLAVSEELYSSDLQRHNINNIFVLVERIEDDIQATDVTKIYKYTSTKEIYNKIIGSIREPGREKPVNETIVALLYSPIGGVGKTVLSLGISACLAQGIKKVLYINAERMNTFQYYLMNNAPIKNDVLSELTIDEKSLFNKIKHILRNEGFDYIPPFGAALSSLNIDFNIYYKIIRELRYMKEYDVIVVDTDSIFDNEKAMLLTIADKVFMVTDQSAKAVFSMNTLMKNMNCNDKDKYYFICNKFDETQENVIMDETKCSFMVNEYVKYFKDNSDITIEKLMNNFDIQKISYLLS